MKTISDISSRSCGRARFRRKLPARRMTVAGFTLAELMVALAIFGFLIGGMVAVQVFGLRVQTLAATKLIATQNGRETLDAMRDQIRSANQVYVGIFDPSAGTFSRITNAPQIGNAIQLFTSTNWASPNYTIFYQDPSVNTVYSVTNNPATTNVLDGLTVLAQYMTNYYCFDAEDYRQVVLTNYLYLNNPVIGITMAFSQWEYPIGYVGGVGVDAYDYYYLRTHITRRLKQ